jgi:hypothetical protein
LNIAVAALTGLTTAKAGEPPALLRAVDQPYVELDIRPNNDLIYDGKNRLHTGSRSVYPNTISEQKYNSAFSNALGQLYMRS